MIPLATKSLAGRAPLCAIVLSDRFASSEHARLSWTGRRWQIRDLGSRNGTFVNEERVAAGEARPLVVGDRIGFGNPDPTWVLDAADGPTAVATNLGSGAVRGDEHLLVLPTDTDPRVSVYRDKIGQWVLEDTTGEVRPVATEDVVFDGEQAWRLDLPDVAQDTPMVDLVLSLDTATINMAVSPDEEFADIALEVRGIETPVERREHNYLLLILARARREDEALPEPDRGWRTIDQLSRMLRLDRNALNVAIHRARRYLAKAGLEGAARVVEVKPDHRRLGTGRFRIKKLDA